jgi:Bromodomain
MSMSTSSVVQSAGSGVQDHTSSQGQPLMQVPSVVGSGVTSPFVGSASGIVPQSSRQTSTSKKSETAKPRVRQTVASKGKRLASKGKRGSVKPKPVTVESSTTKEAIPSKIPEASGSVSPSLFPKVAKKDIAHNMSLVSVMSKDMIQKHLDSLNKRIHMSSRTVTYKCLPLVQELLDDQFGWVFKDPVDPVALGLPDYFDVVKTPMHLDLVKKKLENAIYSDMNGCARDVRLVFENAILYNGEASEVGKLAQSMLDMFGTSFTQVMKGKCGSKEHTKGRV